VAQEPELPPPQDQPHMQQATRASPLPSDASRSRSSTRPARALRACTATTKGAFRKTCVIRSPP